MEISHIFHVPENQIRVISPDVGGGFGLKGGAYPDDLLVMWASKKLGRPVKWVAVALREHDERRARPRDGLLRRARARRQRQDPRAALEVAVPDGRLVRQRGARRRRVLDPLRAGGLRHPDHAPDVAGRVHQHLVLGPVPRRRPPGGGVLHGAADRARRAADRHGRRGNPPPQPDPAVEAALHHADPLGLRLRRVREADGHLHRAQRSQGLRRARSRVEEERQAARPRGQLLHRVRRHLQRPHGAALRSLRRAHRLRRHAFARPGPRHRVRAGRARLARRAVRARSSTCRATPPRSRSAAAPMARARPWSAAARSSARPTDDREGQGARRRHDGGGRRRHRVQGRHLRRHRHRQEDRAGRRRQGVVRADGPAHPEVRHRARGRGQLLAGAAEPSERLSRLRGRGRSGDRRGDARRAIT